MSPEPLPSLPIATNMADSPKISIAMCTYNGAKFLQEQLESFVNQSLRPDHLVVCEDASTDATRQMLTAFAGKSPFPVELHFNTSTLGVAKNFEQALLACKGEYVALSDQDDRWHVDKLQRLTELLEANPNAGFACSDAELIDKRGRSLRRKLWEAWRTDPERLARRTVNERRAYSVRSNCVTGATMIVRRKTLWDFLAPIPRSWVHDHWLAVLSEVLNRPGCSTSELLTQYRLHAGQTIGIGSRNWFRKAPSVAERAQKILQKRQRYFDLLAHLEDRILPRIPEAAVWIDVIENAQLELMERQKEIGLPWWHRGWNRFVRRQRRAA